MNNNSLRKRNASSSVTFYTNHLGRKLGKDGTKVTFKIKNSINEIKNYMEMEIPLTTKMITT
jgi:hypothetical protein